MRIKFLLTIAFISFSFVLCAQVSISGVVNDVHGQPIPGAAVYLASTKAATVTDPNGKFRFTNMPVGGYDVLAQMIGFKPNSVKVQLSDKDETVTLVLSEATIGIDAVTIVPTVKRQQYMGLFMDYFIGRTENSTQCRIKNPEALYFHLNKRENVLSVSTNEFLEVENKALGYLVRYYLKEFRYNFNTKVVYYEGLPNFEDLTDNAGTQKKWIKARERAYKGSAMHFYRTLASKTTAKEGFVIKKNVMTRMNSMSSDGKSSGIPTTLRPNNEDVAADTLLHKLNNDLDFLNFTSDLYIIYVKEVEAKPYSYSGYRLERPSEFGTSQISKIQPLQLPFYVYPNGTLVDPSSVIYSGFWAYEKIADQLPMDYEPESKRKK